MRVGFALTVVALAMLVGIRGTQDAVANGDTRTLTIYHTHSKESATVTFKQNGSYDQAALKQLNWLLRDWRLDEETRMEPRLFDILWEVYREVGSEQPIHVVSAYRAPETNAMLRRRSRAVAEHSQHMAGRAMDFYLPDVSMSRVREIGMRLQGGGVGFYPNAFNPFVHLDAGSVRSWPRMSYDQLARLFPNGRTVHLPREGKPLAGYEEAKAEILSRGGTVAGTSYAEAGEEATGRKSLWAALFGGGDDEDSDYYRSAASRDRSAGRGGTRLAYAPAGGNSEDGGTRGFVPPAEPRGDATVRARRGARTEVASIERPAGGLPTGTAPGFETSRSDGAPAFVPSDQAEAEAPAPSSPTSRPAVAAGPLPPRRPGEFGILASSAPLPPSRPDMPTRLAFSGLSSEPSERTLPGRAYGAPAWAADDDRAALKALFDATAPRAPERRADVTTARARTEPVGDAVRLGESGLKVRMAFSAGRDDLPAGTFRGPAVAPLPRLP